MSKRTKIGQNSTTLPTKKEGACGPWGLRVAWKLDFIRKIIDLQHQNKSHCYLAHLLASNTKTLKLANTEP